MKVSPSVYFLLLLFGATACQSGADLDAVARETCACLQPMADFMQENTAAALQEQSAEQAEALTDRFEKIIQEGETCTGKLEDKYPEFRDDVSPEQEAALRAALAQRCPDVVQMMDGQVAE